MGTSLDLRAVLLQVIHDKCPKGPIDAPLTQGSVLEETAIRVGRHDQMYEEAILTTWHDLFRTGYLGWGKNLANPNPPFFHITASGRRALASIGRDPANPGGYLKHLYSIATLQPIAKSYLEEGLECFVAGLYKAAAVMVGASSESLIFEVRDCIVQKLDNLSRPVPKKLNDWRLKTVIDGIQTFFDGHKSSFPRALCDEFEGYWMAFAQQIRAVRNDAGHPTSINHVTPDTVHASLLIFPELAKLAEKLRTWVTHELK